MGIGKMDAGSTADNAASFGYTEIALLIFFAVFVAIVIWALLRPRSEVSKCSRMPLDDDKVQDDRTKRPQ